MVMLDDDKHQNQPVWLCVCICVACFVTVGIKLFIMYIMVLRRLLI